MPKLSEESVFLFCFMFLVLTVIIIGGVTERNHEYRMSQLKLAVAQYESMK